MLRRSSGIALGSVHRLCTFRFFGGLGRSAARLLSMRWLTFFVTENLGSAMMPYLSLHISCIRCSVLVSMLGALLLLFSRCILLLFLLLSFLLSGRRLLLLLFLSVWLIELDFFEPSNFLVFYYCNSCRVLRFVVCWAMLRGPVGILFLLSLFLLLFLFLCLCLFLYLFHSSVLPEGTYGRYCCNRIGIVVVAVGIDGMVVGIVGYDVVRIVVGIVAVGVDCSCVVSLMLLLLLSMSMQCLSRPYVAVVVAVVFDYFLSLQFLGS